MRCKNTNVIDDFKPVLNTYKNYYKIHFYNGLSKKR